MINKIFNYINIYLEFAREPLADMKSLEKGLLPQFQQIDTKKQELIVKRIIASYISAKQEQPNVPAEYQISGVWQYHIDIDRSEFLTAVKNNDVSELCDLFGNFFRNSGVCGITTHTNYPDICNGDTTYKKKVILEILKDYKELLFLVDNEDSIDLAYPKIGNPWGYFIGDTLISTNECRYVYYANHIKSLLEDTENPVIAEIGGGYGGFAYQLQKTIPCKYIDFDIPEVGMVAQYYLMMTFPEKKFLLYGETQEDLTKELLNQYDIIMMPNFVLPRLASQSVDLFINTASLSEMNHNTVKEYISNIARVTKRYFFHENSERAVSLRHGTVEVTSSKFGISDKIFKKIYKTKSVWGGGGSRYYEHLYERINDGRK